MSQDAINARPVAGMPNEEAGIHGAVEQAEVAPGDLRGPGALRTTLLIASVTFREAARRRLLWIAMFAGCAFLGLFAAALHAVLKQPMPLRGGLVARNEGLQIMTMMVLYAGSMLTSLMAALASCDSLSGEIASGTIHAIATKPVGRAYLVLGKWVGFVVMITLYVLLVEGGSIGISAVGMGFLRPHSLSALGLIWLQAILLLSITMAASTRFSTLTSAVVALGLYGVAFVGGWIEQFGALRHVPTCVTLGILSSLIMPSDALWRRAAFHLQPPLLAAAGAGPFASTMVTSGAMILYAGLYALLALVVAQILFTHRDL